MAPRNYHPPVLPAGWPRYNSATEMLSPPHSSAHDVSTLLHAWSDGDQGALARLTPIVYAELRRLARRYMRGERPGHSLQTTALVNEAYMRLVDYKRMQWQNRAHFFAVSAQLMRRILVEHARRHNLKRGGDVPHVSLDEAAAVGSERAADLVALDDAMNALARLDPRKVQVVEMRFFGGLSVEETAEVLKVSPITVMRDWSTAKAWLYRELSGGTKRWIPNGGNRSIACCSPPWSVRRRSARSFCGRRARAMRRWSGRSGRCWPRSRRREVSWRVRRWKWPRGQWLLSRAEDMRPPSRRPDHLPLPHHREVGRGRDGGRLESPRHAPGPLRGAQASARRQDERSRAQAALRAGSQGRLRAQPSEHHHHLRYRPGGWRRFHRHGVRARQGAGPVDPAQRAAAGRGAPSTRSRWPTRWRRRTRPASCIAT